MRRREWGDWGRQTVSRRLGRGGHTGDRVAICPQHYISPGNNVTTLQCTMVQEVRVGGRYIIE